MKTKKLVAVFLALVMVAALGAGCTKTQTTPPAPDQPAPKEPMVLRYNLGVEPETLDTAKMTGIPEFNAVLPALEGLTRIKADGMPGPGMAYKWDISEGGTKYVFYLRDAKWSNGDPVTAYDFEFAWKRALDPEVAADYAYMLYHVKGAEAYNSGEGSVDDVGVRALDDKTLEVHLETNAPFFLDLCAFPTYMPVPSKVVKANPDWHASAATFVSNGPFKLTKWEHHSILEYEKNPDYWDKDAVKLDKLVFYMVEESSTELTMFETGEIDYADNPPLPEIDRLKAQGVFKVSSLLGTYYYIFNTEKPPLNDWRVRKALTLAISRKDITEKVTKAGQLPALAWVPPDIPDAKPGPDFREVGGNYFKDNDVETARALLAEAGYPGGKGMPPLEILYNTSEAHKAIAEVIQEMWKKNLGIENVTLTNQEWKVYLATRDAGTFMIARAGWLGDYNDPMTFLDMWVTGGGNNNSRWSNKEYDALVTKARLETDPVKRMQMLHELEDMLFADGAWPIMPIYYYVDSYLMKDYVKGVYISPLGPIDFKHAWIDK